MGGSFCRTGPEAGRLLVGREATCKCEWAGTTADVKVLLESGEIILRGGIRKRLSLSEVKQVKVAADRLCFTAGRDPVQLFLGSDAAERWAAAISIPPPSLARKLGIATNTIVRTIGSIDDRALQSALDEAERISAKDSGLIVAYVDTPASLHEALRIAMPQLLKNVPIWIVHAKGSGHPLDETAIRSLLRDNGMMDTKVASVSDKLSALRFCLKKLDKRPQKV
jgi:hypothetical protein